MRGARCSTVSLHTRKQATRSGSFVERRARKNFKDHHKTPTRRTWTRSEASCVVGGAAGQKALENCLHKSGVRLHTAHCTLDRIDSSNKHLCTPLIRTAATHTRTHSTRHLCVRSLVHEPGSRVTRSLWRALTAPGARLRLQFRSVRAAHSHAAPHAEQQPGECIGRQQLQVRTPERCDRVWRCSVRQSKT